MTEREAEAVSVLTQVTAFYDGARAALELGEPEPPIETWRQIRRALLERCRAIAERGWPEAEPTIEELARTAGIAERRFAQAMRRRLHADAGELNEGRRARRAYARAGL